METNRIDITKGPSKEEMAEVYRKGNQKDVIFELYYGVSRISAIDILEILSVQETSVKMLASMPAGLFMYSQGDNLRTMKEKTEKIEVYVFYTTNTGKGYIEKKQSDLEVFNSLNVEYKIYIEELKRNWRGKNKAPEFRDVVEVLRPDQRKELDNYIKRWSVYGNTIRRSLVERAWLGN